MRANLRQMLGEDLIVTLLLVGVFVALAVGPPTVALAAAGVPFTAVAVIALTAICRPGGRSTEWLRVVPYLALVAWIAFCTFRGTHSWLWTVVTVIGTMVTSGLLGGLDRRVKRAVTRRQRSTIGDQLDRESARLVPKVRR